MTIKVFQVGYVQTNCYVLTKANQEEAVIIDPGGGYQRIINYLKEESKKPTAILLTHGHFDHYLAAKELQDNGAKIYIHKLDEELLTEKQGLASTFGLDVPSVTPDYLFEDNHIITVGGFEFKVIHTPGHSKGSSCFITEDRIFSGDTLFWKCYGRTDFFGGSTTELKKSLNKLFALEGDYKVYPGHDRTTTLEFERHNNPIL